MEASKASSQRVEDLQAQLEAAMRELGDQEAQVKQLQVRGAVLGVGRALGVFECGIGVTIFSLLFMPNTASCMLSAATVAVPLLLASSVPNTIITITFPQMLLDSQHGAESQMRKQMEAELQALQERCQLLEGRECKLRCANRGGA